MNVKRPLLLMAVVYVLGVCVSAGECGFVLRGAAGILFACLVFHGIKKKTLRKSALALLFVLLLAGGLRYQLSARAFQRSEERIRIFGGMKVCLRGEVQEYTEAAGKAKLRVRNALLSSAYGTRDTLPASATAVMRARYDQPVGTILVYLEAEDEAAQAGWRGGDRRTAQICAYPEKRDEDPKAEDSLDAHRPLPGEQIEVYGKISPAEAARNEGQFDFRLYYRTISVHGSMYGTSFRVIGGDPKPFARGLQALRLRMGTILDQLLPPQDAGIYRALLTGDKSAMDEDIRSLYQENGIAHILAVSGLHLSILGLGVYELLRRFGRSKAASGIVAALLIVSYGILTGCSGSALRAVLMLLLRFLGAAVGRSYDMLTAMAAAALFLLWKEPFMLFSAGFQLSFLAVLAIGLSHALPAPKHPLLAGLWISFYLQLLTLPVILFHYFRFPFYGIFLNLIVLPLMGCVIYSGVFGVGLFALSEKLATIAIGGGHWILRLYTLLCMRCATLPYSSLLLGRPSMHSILLYYTALGFVTWTLAEWKTSERSRLPLPCIVLPLVLSLLCLPAKQPQGLEITALDVGQGDGFILRNQGLVMSVDGGSTSNQRLGENVLVPYLESQGIEHIDLALITHCDADHYSGILYLLEEEPKISIGELLLPRVAVQDARYDALRDAAAARDVQIRYFGQGDSIALGEVEIRGYYPAGTAKLEAANDHSIGMLLHAPDFQMLFTGDMDEACEQQMLAALWEANAGYPKIDVLKAGHHGSHTSSSEALLAALRPDYAILSYGVGNDYGHPHVETRERLERYGVEMLETGKMGEIRLTV
ncbi:MAG: DNA internalization-related competence protein ComEC/Rec2 [Lachnospiraceae bacterium]|nr:DNA internalization-related competence protein ComEC/Rec2 [Lachnospiraceae bacterium]